MASTTSFTIDWNGETIKTAAVLAANRAAVRCADDGAHYAKDAAPVVTGTYQRSIHTADSTYDGSSDFDAAGGGKRDGSGADLQEDGAVEPSDSSEFSIFLGSWVPYAQEVEDNYGCIQSGIEQAEANFESYFQEELGTTLPS